ncbi:MAG: hypothetical protein U0176_04900 [Bacteroidia bacterium]
MKHIDTDKIDQAVLALLYLTSENNASGMSTHGKAMTGMLPESATCARVHRRHYQQEQIRQLHPEGFELAKEAFERLRWRSEDGCAD